MKPKKSKHQQEVQKQLRLYYDNKAALSRSLRELADLSQRRDSSGPDGLVASLGALQAEARKVRDIFLYSLVQVELALTLSLFGAKVSALHALKEALSLEALSSAIADPSRLWLAELSSNSEKMTTRSVSSRFSPAECRLISLISERKMSRVELMQALYGENAELDLAENRLKNLLGRIRSKCEGLIIMERGRYRLGKKVEVT